MQSNGTDGKREHLNAYRRVRQNILSKKEQGNSVVQVRNRMEGYNRIVALNKKSGVVPIVAGEQRVRDLKISIFVE